MNFVALIIIQIKLNSNSEDYALFYIQFLKQAICLINGLKKKLNHCKICIFFIVFVLYFFIVLLNVCLN